MAPNTEPIRKFRNIFITAVVITTLFSIIGITMVNAMIDSRFRNLQRLDVNLSESTGATQPANFLLIGSDTRAFVETDLQREQFMDGEDDIGQRSDTMMIIHVDPKAKKTTVMSIPRDTKVDIPGIGVQKINASYNTELGGGPDKVVETIEKNFRIPIHHYIEIDFESFKQVVDALGTVNVYFPAPARDNNNGRNESGLDTQMQSGCLPLNGDQALSYVRSRYYEQYIDGRWQKDPTSNFGRIARQQEFMRRVASHAVQRSLDDPLKGRDVVDSVVGKLVVDRNLSKTDIFKLMNTFKGVDPSDPEHVRFEVLPVKSERQNGIWFDIIQTQEAEPLYEIFRQTRSSSGKPSSTTLPRPSAVKVSVLNGSSVTGLAANTIEDLMEIGFMPGPTGNASSLVETEIHYTKANEEKAILVSQYITGRLIEVSAIADADVVIKLGKNFSEISMPAKNNEGNQSPASTTTTRPEREVDISGVDSGVECPI